MMSVKVIRSTLEKPKQFQTGRYQPQKPSKVASSHVEDKHSSVNSSTYVKVLDRMKGHLMKKPGGPST